MFLRSKDWGNNMQKRINIKDVSVLLDRLEKKFPEYQTPIVDLIEAQTKQPWKVLVATILSARTNDATTAEAVKRLFSVVNSIKALCELSVAEIEKLIYPVGFFRNKAKYLKALYSALENEFQGEIPETVEALIKLPGVGRKTANLVVAIGFHKPAICVDTHVHRIMNIWGFVKTKTPLETEMQLREKLPVKYWLTVNSLMVAHGQAVCRPVSPKCWQCVLEPKCLKLNVKPRKKEIVVKKKSSNTIDLISWNVNGIRAAEKKDFISYVKKSSAEIIAIQETKAQTSQLSDELVNIDGYTSHWFSAQKKGYSGVAIYTKINPINVINGIAQAEFDDEGRVITAEYKNFYLINCYFPNSQDELKRIDYKLAFNKAILNYCNILRKKKTVLICGDFNVAHKAIDLKNPKANENNAGYSLPEREAMDKFIAAGYVDTFRMFNRSPEEYSWWSYRFSARSKNIGWRIDYFCVDEKSKDRICNAHIFQNIMGSDHCPVGVTISVD